MNQTKQKFKPNQIKIGVGNFLRLTYVARKGYLNCGKQHVCKKVNQNQKKKMQPPNWNPYIQTELHIVEGYCVLHFSSTHNKNKNKTTHIVSMACIDCFFGVLFGVL